MPKRKPKPRTRKPPTTPAEDAQRAHEIIMRRQQARAKRIRALARAVNHQFHRLEADIETHAMSILHDRGFVVVDKKRHNELIDENMSQGIRIAQLEQELERAIAEAMLGRPLAADEEVDHVDGNTLNNHHSNLRVVTASEHAKKTRAQQHAKRQQQRQQTNGETTHGEDVVPF